MKKKYPHIQSRLVFGLLVLIILSLFISIYYINDVHKLNHTIDKIIMHPYTVTNSIRDINIYINAMHRSMKDVTLAENETQLNEAISQVDAYEKLVYKKFEIVSKRFLGDPKDIAIAYEAFVNWKPIRDEVIDLVKKDNSKKAASITKNKGATYVNMLMNKTQTMIVFADSQANEYNIQSLTIHKNAQRKAYFFIISSLIFGLATFIWVIRSVNRPLDKIINKIKRIPTDQFINKFPENKKNKLALLDFVFIELEDQKKLLEVQVNERTEDLTEARNLIENAIENASGGIVTIDFKGCLINVNHAFCIFTGYSKGESLKMKFKDFTQDQDEKGELEFINKVVDGEIKNESFEKRFIHKSGKIIQGSVTASILKDSNNKPISLFAQIRDITKQKKYELELIEHKKGLEIMVNNRTKELDNQTNKLVKSQKALTYLLEDVNESQEKMKILNEQIVATNKELEAFSYSVSHDLKAPLRAITGFSQILEEDYSTNLDKDAKEYIALIKENAVNMGTLINDLLNFSRMGRASLHKSQVDMKAIAERIKNELQAGMQDRRIKLKIHPMPMVNADETLIYQVMQNLISNAVKFSKMNGGSLVEVGCSHQKNSDIFFVKDNGIGFDMKYAEKIFDVFQRLHSTDEYEGTGIGLAIVQRIILKHEGRIWVQSEINKGSTFFFTI